MNHTYWHFQRELIPVVMTENNRVAIFLLHIIPSSIHLAALCRLATEDLGGDFRMIQFF